MSLKYEPASEPLHISCHSLGRSRFPEERQDVEDGDLQKSEIINIKTGKFARASGSQLIAGFV